MHFCACTGFSDFPELQGTYRGTCSWFEVRVTKAAPQPDLSSQTGSVNAHGSTAPTTAATRSPTTTIRFQENVHASWQSRDHTNTWDVRDPIPWINEWLRGLEVGDVVEVFAMAQYPGWRNYVEFVEIELCCAWT
jgi:hypothetical protein